MNKILKNVFLAASVVVFLSIPLFAQQVKRTPFDVTNYQMDVALVPNERRLNATVDVTFKPLEDTRTITFELNGSLKIDSITWAGAPPSTAAAANETSAKPAGKGAPKPTSKPAAPEVTFVQDQVGVADIGPSVRIDLGDNVTKGTPVTLRFKYSGVLELPAGGPLLSKRLAYIGPDHGYLMYAARWFPFHDYAADLATADITISLPAGLTMVGYSDSPVANTGGKYRFTESRPALIGNFAYGKFTPKPMTFGDYELQFYARPGNDDRIAKYGETLGKALTYYAKTFGPADTSKKLNVIEIDDDSLDFYSRRECCSSPPGRSRRLATSRSTGCSVRRPINGGD